MVMVRAVPHDLGVPVDRNIGDSARPSCRVGLADQSP